MDKRVWRECFRQMVLVIALALIPVGMAAAETANSPNYQVTETQFNSGMSLESCSSQYCAQTSLGELGSGTSSSSSSESTVALFGTLQGEDPLLEVIVEPGASNLGVLTTEKTATKTTVVRIRSYLSDGYVFQLNGEPPSYGEHQLKTSSSPSPSEPGTEMFGINLVANTTPTLGSDPVQVPSDQLSFGEAAEGYRTPNRFKYQNGDVIGKSRTETGRTDYTISMVVNIANNTPAGRFLGDYSVVVIPYY